MDRGAWVKPIQAPTLSLTEDVGVGRRQTGGSQLTVTFPFPSVYRCGSTRGWSRRFRFRALKNGPHWSPRLAVFGDLGADNPRALPRLRRDTQQGMYDAVLHVGEALARVCLEVWGEGGSGGSSPRTMEGTGALRGLGTSLAVEMVSVVAGLPSLKSQVTSLELCALVSSLCCYCYC